MCGTFGLLLWVDVTVFTIVRLRGVQGFLSSGLMQALPTWLILFAAVGLAGSPTGPIAERLRKREAAKGLAAT